MPQVDIAVFLPIIISLFCTCTFYFGFILVYLLFPFVAGIKAGYSFLSKIKQFKSVLILFY